MRVLSLFAVVTIGGLTLPGLSATQASAESKPELRADAMFGEVEIFAPPTAPRGVIALLSDETGFGRDETVLAESFEARGDLVIGLSWPSWRRHVAARRRENCDDLLDHVEDLVAGVERDRAVSPYLTPVLAGLGLGGSAARALAPEAAVHRIAGVVAVRAGTSIEADLPICGAIARRRGSSWVYEAPGRPALRELQEADEGAAAEAVEAFESGAGPHGPGDLSDLPLFVTMPRDPATRLAVILTGDGGMGALNWDLANALASRGIAVATIDSRRYFWSERDPATVAKDLQRIFRHFRHESHVERVALVGYSFGADALPLVYGHLSAHARRDVAVVSLLSVAPMTDLKIELRDEDYTNAVPLLAEAARIDAPVLQCIYGEGDPPAAFACPALALARPDLEVTRTAGGHGFDGDTDRLADLIAAPLFAAPVLPPPTTKIPPLLKAAPAATPARTSMSSPASALRSAPATP